MTEERETQVAPQEKEEVSPQEKTADPLCALGDDAVADEAVTSPVAENVLPGLSVDAMAEVTADACVVADMPVAVGDEVTEPSSVASRTERVGRLIRRRWNRIDILGVTAENDLRYRGPLSYRWLRILAWLFFLLSQVGYVLTVAGKLDAGYATRYGTMAEVFKFLSSAITPLFLIASFTIIMNGSRKFSGMIALYGFATLLVVGLYYLLYYRYIMGLAVNLLGMERESLTMILEMLLSEFGNGFFAFNLFLDLFLCTLFVCFLLYRPKRFFTGKRLILFRAFSFLPALYEVASLTLKLMACFGDLVLPIPLMAFLTTKPPMTFLWFVLLALFLKLRERKFLKAGRTPEEYGTFLYSNVNSYQLSSFMTKSICCIIAADLLITVVVSLILSTTSQGEMTFSVAQQRLAHCGIGSTVSLVLIIPFIKMFSYTRSYKDRRADIILPIVALFFLGLIYVEAFYQGLLFLPDWFK